MVINKYTGMILSLLPKGKAWKVLPGKKLYNLLSAFAKEAGRVEAFFLGLIAEANPATATDYLPEWENQFGIQWNGKDSVDVRRTNILSKLASLSDQSLSYYIALAKRYGFTLTITEYQQAVAGSFAGCLCVNKNYKLTATFNLPVNSENVENKSSFQLAVEKYKQAHIIILFNWR